jgi:hypothetical protein
MTDKDREAFEAWCKNTSGYRTEGKTNPLLNRKEYTTVTTYSAWDAWRAARDHYAPKLIEKEAVRIACNAYANQQKAMGYGYYPVEAGSATHESLMAVMAALRAAGVQFKEEA